jgi:predicted DNA-binding antitoxin AbrB/MazE fold protein
VIQNEKVSFSVYEIMVFRMKININDFRVQEGEKVNLKKWPTLVEPVYKSKKNYHKQLEEQVEELSSLQRLHYASN